MKEPETAKKIDWRAHGVSWTTEPFTDPVSKNTFDKGAIIRPVARVRHGKTDLFVTVPNASALFLNLSRNFHNEAADLMRECLAVKGNDRPLPDEPTYSFFEKMMGSVVFACAALEAFVNESVPDAYVHEDASDKRFTTKYNKEQIERQLSLKVKLGAVLPDALNISLSKEGNLWHSVVKLIDLRDRVIHLKAKDRTSTKNKPDSLWNDLFTSPLLGTYLTAKRLIDHFLKSSNEQPRWFQKCPF
jgi:hypothetical protein